MIPGVPSMGGMELLIILAIILLFFGAKRVPELARSLGRGKREFHRGIEETEAEEQQYIAAEAHDERGDEARPREEARSKEARESGTRDEENSRVERSPH